MKRIVVIDGQGGGLGKAVIERIKKEPWQHHELLAAGTNAVATATMIRAGADAGATGESAIIWNCRHADIVVGAVGILAAGSMLGELNENMALAIGSCEAVKILIPFNKCRLEIAGISEISLSERLEHMINLLRHHID